MAGGTGGYPAGVVLAFLLTLLLHAAVLLVLPERLRVRSGGGQPEEEPALQVTLAKPDPDDMRFVEANPEAPENEPDRKDQYSFRAQQSADRAPDENPLNAPNVDGETDSQKVVQGAVEEPEPLPPGVYAEQKRPGEGPGNTGGKAGTGEAREKREPSPTEQAAVPPSPRPPKPDFLQQEPEDEEGPGSSEREPGEADKERPEPEEDTPIDVYRPPEEARTAQQPSAGQGGGGSPEARPKPRERPRLSPELVRGPLMRSQGTASRRGVVAIDATFSEFGEYQQQFYAAVQAGWYQQIKFYQPMDTSARVQVRFTMKADGSIENVEVVETTASEIATVICESAISKRSPFRPWTRQMVEVFGRERTLNVMFHYR